MLFRQGTLRAYALRGRNIKLSKIFDAKQQPAGALRRVGPDQQESVCLRHECTSPVGDTEPGLTVSCCGLGENVSSGSVIG